MVIINKSAAIYHWFSYRTTRRLLKLDYKLVGNKKRQHKADVDWSKWRTK